MSAFKMNVGDTWTLVIEEDDAPGVADAKPRKLAFTTDAPNALTLNQTGDFTCDVAANKLAVSCSIFWSLADDGAITGTTSVDVVDPITSLPVKSFGPKA